MKRICFFLVSTFVSAMAMAQNGGADVNIDVTKSGGSSGFPWLWIVGGIVFIILLVALLGGRGGTDRIIEKKTVVRD